MSLTALQRDTLNFIEGFIQANGGMAPTFKEIGDSRGLRSRSSVHRILVALEERGYLQRHPERARSLSVVKSAGQAGRAIHDLTPDLLALLESTMWAASVDQHEGRFAPGCSLCGAERPSDPLALCTCRLGRTVQRARAAMLQAGEGAK